MRPVPLTYNNIIGEMRRGLSDYLYVKCQNPDCGEINHVPDGKTHRFRKTKPGMPCFDVNTKLGTGHAVQGGHCPRGYDNMFNGTCYLLSHDKATWTGAMVSCQILGGHLVEIGGLFEAEHLKTIIQNKGLIRWIALTNKRAVNTWEWATSHTSPSYLNWAAGEPDNYNHDQAHEESCAAMDSDHGHNFAWSDLECSRNELYICEAEAEQMHPLVIIGG